MVIRPHRGVLISLEGYNQGVICIEASRVCSPSPPPPPPPKLHTKQNVWSFWKHFKPSFLYVMQLGDPLGFLIFTFYFEIRLYLFRNKAILACGQSIQCLQPLPTLLLPACHSTIFATFVLLDAECAILTNFTTQKLSYNCTALWQATHHFKHGARLFFYLVCRSLEKIIQKKFL